MAVTLLVALCVAAAPRVCSGETPANQTDRAGAAFWPDLFSHLHDGDLLYHRLVAGAAPPALLRRMEAAMALQRRLAGLPECAPLAARQTGTRGEPCWTPQTFTTRPPLLPFGEVLPATLRRIAPAAFRHYSKESGKTECFPFLCNTAWQYLGDYACTKEHKYKHGHPCHFPPVVPNRSLLFVAGYCLKDFLPLLPRLPHFFLLTHWSDAAVDPRNPYFSPILEHPRLLRWFAYSAEVPHPRLIPLPLGMSHAMAERILQTPLTPPSAATALLLAKFNVPEPLRQGPADVRRTRKAYVKRRQDAAAIFQFKEFGRLAGATKRVPLKEFHAAVLRHRFTLSPPGNARDCYRTWEVLALGRVPVLQTFALYDFFYEGLPVLKVPDWHQLTPAFLAAQWPQYLGQAFAMEKVTVCPGPGLSTGRSHPSIELRTELKDGKAHEGGGWGSRPLSPLWSQGDSREGGCSLDHPTPKRPEVHQYKHHPSKASSIHQKISGRGAYNY
eukprot:EG_transcript_7908